jgi:hypothetical protein
MNTPRLSVVSAIVGLTVLFTGCATFAEKQTGRITSEPDGAKVSFYEPQTSKRLEIGVTPTDAHIQQGLFEIYLIGEKHGYEREQILVPKAGDISHHFSFERSYALQIIEEASSLPKEFKKDVARILGTYDRALSSPRMLSSSVASEARAQVQELILDHPDLSSSATVRALRRLSEATTFVTNLDSYYYNTQIERDAAGTVRELIFKIQIGLGLER